MTAAKHTPGPWAQHPSFPWIIKQDLSPIADVSSGVAVCNTTAHENSGFFPTPDEGRANAILIAAAPERRQALQAMGGKRGVRQGYASCETYDKARAAIAKATGATP